MSRPRYIPTASTPQLEDLVGYHDATLNGWADILGVTLYPGSFFSFQDREDGGFEPSPCHVVRLRMILGSRLKPVYLTFESARAEGQAIGMCNELLTLWSSESDLRVGERVRARVEVRGIGGNATPSVSFIQCVHRGEHRIFSGRDRVNPGVGPCHPDSLRTALFDR